MAMLGMPLLILNLGGEMVYILDQRLKAQNIPGEKSVKVLQDVVRAMFTRDFIAELFKPQELYSSASARQIFDKLAHSSIMRLSTSSMNKLYDLMTMGFKYQILACSHPGELLDITINHLMTVISMVRDQAAVDSVQHAIGLVTSTYSTCTPSDFTLLRETLAAHFQDKKVKVSLFLQDGIQKDDGTFVLDTRGPPPPNAEAPGEIRYSDGTVQVIDVPTRDHAAQGRVGMVLGGNVYAKDRPPPPPAPAPAPASASVGGGAPARSGPLGDPSAMAPRRGTPARKGTGTQEMTFLADLIGGDEITDDAASAAAKMNLNLFGDDDSDAAGGGGGDTQSQMITIDVGQTASSHVAGLMGELSMDGGGGDGGGGEDDDLLDLLDGAE